MKTILEIDNLGKVEFIQSKRNKRIVFSRRPLQAPRISYPTNVTTKQALLFLKNNLKKILTFELKQREIEKIIIEKNKISDKKIKITKLNHKIKFIQNKYGFTPNKITLRNQTTRWGSCSGKNNISLNINLIKLPDILQTYVIIHEFIHLKIKNHGPLFWQEIEKYLPNARLLNQELKKYSDKVYFI